VSVSRLCAIAEFLGVPAEFFFADAPPARHGAKAKKPPMVDLLDSFPNATDDYALVGAYLRIKDARMKRRIVALVQAIVGD